MDSTTSIPEIPTVATLLVRAGGGGDAVYGCDIRDAQELIPLRPATRIPGAPPFVRGLINVRGTIVTVLDLGARLDPSRPPVESGSIVLVRYRDRLVGIAVEEVLDVRELVIDEASMGASGGAITRGVATTDDATIVVLDLEALIRQILLS